MQGHRRERRPVRTMEGIERVRRILILELGGIGDAILSIPALVAVVRRFPEAHVTVLSVPRTRTVFSRMGEFMEDDPGKRRGRFSLASAGLWAGLPAGRDDVLSFLSLRAGNFDLLMDLSAIESSWAETKRKILVKYIGAKTSLGRGTSGRGRFFDAWVPEELDSPRHEMDRKLDVAGIVGAVSPLSAPIFPIRGEEREEALSFLRAHGIGEGDLLALMHPSGTGANKMWPRENFSRAGEWLSDCLGARVVVVGGQKSRDLARDITSRAAGGGLVPACSLSLGAVAALLERTALFLTNDSGPMHLAAALGVPTVAIFGQTNLERYLPLLPHSRRELARADPFRCGRGWEGGLRDECRRTSCRSPSCLTAVTLEEVVGKMEALASRIGLLHTFSPALAGGGGAHTFIDDALLPSPPLAGGDGGRGQSRSSPLRPHREISSTPEAESERSRESRRFPAGMEDSGFITRRARDASVRLLRGIEGPVLDLACGKGLLLQDLAERASRRGELWGVDISREQLAHARSRLGLDRRGANGTRTRLVRGDLASLPFKSDSFRASLCVNTMQNLDANGKLTMYLSEISRVTKAGGTVLLELRNSRNPLVIARFCFGRLVRKIPLSVLPLWKVLDAGRRAGLSLSAKEAVGPGIGPLAYSFILIFSKEGGACSQESPR